MKQNTVGYLAVTVLCGLIGFTLGSVLLGRLFVCLSAALLLCLVNSALLLASVRVSTGVGKSVIRRGETARRLPSFTQGVRALPSFMGQKGFDSPAWQSSRRGVPRGSGGYAEADGGGE